jgi:hypothetical protein
MGILTIKLPVEIVPLRSNLIIASPQFNKTMLQHGFAFATAWFYSTPQEAFKRYCSIVFGYMLETNKRKAIC